ncbi:AAA family ATPase [Bacillus sp. DTU_2020_1000418_1_SI_GHA_SEK_038]|uniref:AAA family ATPase n=1 Tax=Bacillus sp. DTU_2020_1000418_1_SI_GHA_SEK_038 TaxID=3077585 RepID=UPI0028EB91F0|nr:AAA family ATPase [Bacillus sp. DTU_2020_1000418_1_SI_GHA_SEK_038]WNS77439.1 AAA family ATPase [Bacillus sp. DTU_2020_1000418_1_SI_GHA_SEK_038]
MNDLKSCLSTLERYLKARIPFISIRTSERARALEIAGQIAHQLSIPVFFHTISQGTRDILSNRLVNDDRSVMGGLDFANQKIAQQQNITFIFTEVQDIEDDTPTARQFQDLAMMATDTGGSIIIITNKPVWGQLQRLGMSITLAPPNEDEMLKIIQGQISPYRGEIPIEWGEEEEKQSAAILAGISQIEAENVIATLLANGAIKNDDLKELMHAKDRIFADISGIERVQVRQDYQVGGLEGMKRWLDANEKLLTADLRDRGIRPPRGILLVGVPGCGKSLSAKAIASQWNLPLYRLDLSTIHGQYLGQSESRLKEALSTANHVAPCVLWIDEIEKGLAGATGGGDGGTSTRLVGQFLYWLQESLARVFVVATANDVSKLPPELLRRGRFDELFFVDLPTSKEREEIIKIYINKGLKREVSPSLLEKLVRLSDGFAGADLEAAVRDVVKQAVVHGDESITDQTFISFFENVVPLSQTSPEQIDHIRAWGRERAVPAGKPFDDTSIDQEQYPRRKGPRSVLV